VPGGLQIEIPGGTDVIVTPAWWAHYKVWYLNIDVRHAAREPGRARRHCAQQLAAGVAQRHVLRSASVGAFVALQTALREVRGCVARVESDYLVRLCARHLDRDVHAERMALFRAEVCSLPKGWEADVEPQKPIEIDIAKRLCGPIVNPVRRDNCMQDVMVTGEVGFADTYLATEKIQLNAIPEAPVLTLPDKSQVNLGETVAFGWKPVKDKDDGKLTYMHCIWLASEKPTFRHCKELGSSAEGTTVSGLKAGQAYFWKVIVDDGQGGTVESELRRFATR
jgi:hypothetical protein